MAGRTATRTWAAWKVELASAPVVVGIGEAPAARPAREVEPELEAESFALSVEA